MPIYMLSEGVFNIVPSEYFLPFAIVFIGATFLRAWALGRSNSRDRDLHGRTIIITGGFTPMGITIITSLAERGAQIVALIPTLSDPIAQLLLPVLQQTTSNPLIFAEECDISSPASIRAFHSQFVKGRTGTSLHAEAPRVDALIFLHEFAHVGLYGALRGYRNRKKNWLLEDKARETAAYGTFLLSTIFLPFLLRMPVDRDVRIINVVNPMYAAAITSFDPTTPLTSSVSTFISQLEGDRSLRSILFARHCQRVLNALANRPPPSTDQNPTHEPVAPKKVSNIKCVTACPGFSRAETIAPFLGASSEALQTSTLGSLLYVLLFPLLFLLTKSAKAAAQTPLYTLFMPHPIKIVSLDPTAGASSTPSSEVTPIIQGGELYRECAPVRLPTGHGAFLANDESVGRAVWEWFERGVEKWEKEEKERGPTAAQNERSATKDEKKSADDGGERNLGSALPNLKGKFKEN